MSIMNSRHTITVNREAYLKLKTMGRFQESYSELILRLMSVVEQNRGES